MKTTQSILRSTGIIGALIATGTGLIHAQDRTTSRNGSDPAAFSGSTSSPSYQRLICAVHPLMDGKVEGTVLFDRQDGGVEVTANIGGLEANKTYAVRIHQYGDLGSQRAESVGGPFQPVSTATSAGSTAGSITSTGSSTGAAGTTGATGSSPGVAGTSPATDVGRNTQSGNMQSDPTGMGSAMANGDGVLKIQKTLPHLQLSAGQNGILGRAVVVHEVASNERLEGGARVAAGVIGISKDAMTGGDNSYNPKDSTGDSTRGTGTTGSGATSGTSSSTGTSAGSGTSGAGGTGSSTGTGSGTSATSGTGAGTGSATGTGSGAAGAGGGNSNDSGGN